MNNNDVEYLDVGVKKNNKKVLLIIFLVIFLIGGIVGLCLNSKSSNNSQGGNEIVQEEKYTISFDSDGGTSINSITVNSGDEIILPEDPKKEGYLFSHWEVNGEIYDFSKKLTGDVTLKAVWIEDVQEKEMIVVKFDTDGGTTVQNQIIVSGEKIIKPSDPVKNGYKFLNWDLNGAIYNFDDIVLESIELTAKWEKIKENTTNTTTKSSNKTTNTTTKSSDKTTNTTTKSSDKTTVKTTQDENQNTNSFDYYTLTFDTQGGSAIVSKKVAYNTKAENVPVPIKDGFAFLGWYLDDAKTLFLPNETLNSLVLNKSVEIQSGNSKYKFDKQNIKLIAGWTQTKISGKPTAYFTNVFENDGVKTISGYAFQDKMYILFDKLDGALNFDIYFSTSKTGTYKLVEAGYNNENYYSALVPRESSDGWYKIVGKNRKKEYNGKPLESEPEYYFVPGKFTTNITITQSGSAGHIINDVSNPNSQNIYAFINESTNEIKKQFNSTTYSIGYDYTKVYFVAYKTGDHYNLVASNKVTG